MLKADVSEKGPGWPDTPITEALDTSLSTVLRTGRQLLEEGLEAALSRKKRSSPALCIFDCAFRRIRPPIPGYSATPVTRCLEAVGFRVSALVVFVIPFGDVFSHQRAVEFDTVGIVDDAIEDGVSKGRFPDDLMPSGDRQLACDHG